MFFYFCNCFDISSNLNYFKHGMCLRANVDLGAIEINCYGTYYYCYSLCNHKATPHLLVCAPRQQLRANISRLDTSDANPSVGQFCPHPSGETLNEELGPRVDRQTSKPLAQHQHMMTVSLTFLRAKFSLYY